MVRTTMHRACQTARRNLLPSRNSFGRHYFLLIGLRDGLVDIWFPRYKTAENLAKH
jgi:hypothetical protein